MSQRTYACHLFVVLEDEIRVVIYFLTVSPLSQVTHPSPTPTNYFFNVIPFTCYHMHLPWVVMCVLVINSPQTSNLARFEKTQCMQGRAI